MKQNKAFTLIEIVITVAIVGILSSFVVIQLIGANNSAKDAKRKMDLETIKNAVVSYQNDHQRLAPTELTTCTIGGGDNPCTTLNTELQDYLSQIPSDPDSDTYYLYQSSADGSDCTITAQLSTGEAYQYDCSTQAIEHVTLINGDCGDDNEQTLDDFPTNLCNQGEATEVLGGGPYFWDCESPNGGTTESCMAYSTGLFTCSPPTTEDCVAPAVAVFKIYDPLGGHAELDGQAVYDYKVCCTGSSISNTCVGSYGIPIKLYSATNSHVEKNTESTYTNNTCLSKTGMKVVCNYANDCSTLGANYTCVASISDGDTNLHVGGCSGAYTTKVCCRTEAL